MAVTVDHATRTIRGTVQDLAQPTGGRGVPSVLHRARARLGIQAHNDYRREREALAGFHGEVPVRSERVVDGWTVEIAGRIDGLVIQGQGDAQTALVEEIKTVAGTRLDVQRLDWTSFEAQARFYALLLHESGQFVSVRARVIACALADGEWTPREVAFDPETTADELIERVRAWLAAAAAQENTAARRAALAHDIRFPHGRVREGQHAMIDTIGKAVEQRRPALISAPTGTGKTAAALFAGLRAALERNTPLVFLTAKTTQQLLAGETFDALVGASGQAGQRLRAYTLRAKEKMCPPATLLCHPDLCKFLRGFDDRLESTGLLESLTALPRATPEEVFDAANGVTLCPFATGLAVAQTVDVLIGDYNYVFDPRVRLSWLFSGEDGAEVVPPVVVVDEAHNLVERARGYYSPFVSALEAKRLMRAIRDPKLFSEAAQGQLFSAAGGAAPHLDRTIQDELHGWLSTVAELCASTRGEMAEAKAPLMEGKGPWRLNAAALRRLAQAGERLLLKYVLWLRAKSVVIPKDPLVDFFGTVALLADLAQEPGDDFVGYVTDNAANEGPGLGVLCVHPGQKLRAQFEACSGVVLMSATMHPLDYFTEMLGLRELQPLTLTLPSPFPPEHRHLAVMPKIDTSWQKRQASIEPLATVVNDLAATRPHNFAVFLPSFAYIDLLKPHIHAAGYDAVFQSPSMSGAERDRVLARMKAFADPAHEGRPVLLVAVMGGAFAEGVDLPGHALTGVVIVGPGLPTVGFERDAIRSHFDLHGGGHGFSLAYLYPGMQRVIQAAGRLIRTERDMGYLLLIDRRFAQENYARCLPPDWVTGSVEDHLTDDPVPGIAEALDRFTRAAVD